MSIEEVKLAIRERLSLLGFQLTTVNAMVGGMTDILAEEIIAGGQSSPHNLLSALHTDTVAAAAVRGDLVVGTAAGTWTRRQCGAGGTFLQSDGEDVAWRWLSVEDLPSHSHAWSDVSKTGSNLTDLATRQHAGLTNIGVNDHHNQQHVLTGTDHTASGLTVGHVLRASGATTFAFAAILSGDLPNHGVTSGTIPKSNGTNSWTNSALVQDSYENIGIGMSPSNLSGKRTLSIKGKTTNIGGALEVVSYDDTVKGLFTCDVFGTSVVGESTNCSILLLPDGTGRVGVNTQSPGTRFHVVNWSGTYPASWPDFCFQSNQSTNTSVSLGLVGGASANCSLTFGDSAAYNDGALVYSNFTQSFTFTLAGAANRVKITGGVLDVATGYQVNGAATAGYFLRGNGTNLVLNTIQSGDLPAHGVTSGTIPKSNGTNTWANSVITEELSYVNINKTNTHFGNNGASFICDNGLNFNYGLNDNGGGWINYTGYNHGSTQFRDLSIGNGKGSAIAFFDGSAGNVGINTDTPLTSIKGSLDLTSADNRGLHIKSVQQNSSIACLVLEGYGDLYDPEIRGKNGASIIMADGSNADYFRINGGGAGVEFWHHVIGGAATQVLEMNVSSFAVRTGVIIGGDMYTLGNIKAHDHNTFSGSVDLRDDVAYNFTPGKSHGIIIISCQTSSIGATIAYNCAGTVTIKIIAQDGTSFAVGTGELTTGTTNGTDTKFNVNVYNGKIYLKNRMGGT